MISKQAFSRVAKYTIVRAITLFITIAIAVYLTIFVANLGGYVDEVIKGNIDFALGMSMKGMKGVTAEEKVAVFEQQREAAYEAAGLNEPFVLRCLRWLGHGLTLNWGETSIDSRDWLRCEADASFAAFGQSYVGDRRPGP